MIFDFPHISTLVWTAAQKCSNEKQEKIKISNLNFAFRLTGVEDPKILIYLIGNRSILFGDTQSTW